LKLSSANMSTTEITLHSIFSEDKLRDYTASGVSGHFSVESDTFLLHTFISTASDTTISTNHAIAAIQALLTFLQRRKPEQDANLPATLVATDGWMRCLELVIQRSEVVKPKLIRQFLGTWISLLALEDSPDVETIIRRLLENLKIRGSRVTAKSTLQTLAHLLSRRVVSTEILLGLVHRELSVDFGGGPVNRSEIVVFYLALFHWAQFPELCPSVGQVIKAVSSQLSKLETTQTRGSAQAAWIKPLLSQIHASPEILPQFKSHIFPDLFRYNVQEYYSFLQAARPSAPLSTAFSDNRREFKDANSDFEREVLFTALQAGKEIGIVEELGMQIVVFKESTNMAPSRRNHP